MTPFWRRWLPRLRREWDEELQSHIVMRAEWNQKNLGMGDEQSKQFAERQFGSRLRIRESIEDLQPMHVLADFVQDGHHALRLFRRAPGFALMAVLTLAAGIAAATAVYSIVDPLLFRDLPFRHGNELVSLGLLGPIDTNEFAMGGMYLDWRDHQTAFSSLTAMRPGTHCELESGRVESVPCVSVQQNFLPTLGVSPLIGRNFTGAEDQPDAPRAALISARIWHSSFGSQPNVLGKVIQLDAAPVRIIGVLPADFVLPQGGEVDVLLPAQLNERLMRAPDATVFLRVFARLKPGVSVTQAQSRMASLFAASLHAVPPDIRYDFHPVLRSVRDRIIQEAKLASRLLLAAVALLLTLTSLTVTNLLLARAHASRTEFAMRAALGASRNRLIRQSLTETLLLSLASGAFGFVLACACIRVLTRLAPGGFLQLQKAQIGTRTFLFSLAVTLVATCLSGTLPALRLPALAALRSYRLALPATAQLRQILTAFQLACSLVLLTGALLFATSLMRIESQPSGFEQNRLTAVSLHLSRSRYQSADRINSFHNALESRLRSVPGIESIALSDSIPPAGSMHGRPLNNIKVAGQPALTGAGAMVVFRYVSASYFRTLGIPVLRGRTFTEAESTLPGGSLVISQMLAAHLFPSRNPLGAQVSLDGGHEWLTVIGVVQDAKNNGLATPASPEYYRTLAGTGTRLELSTAILIRSALGAATLSRLVDHQISALDPTLSPVIEPMSERLRRLNDRPRFLTAVLFAFAFVSVLLSAAGLYGVIAFLVHGRTREFGIRTALGATRLDIIVLVQRQMLWFTLLGLTIGLAGSLSLGRLVRGLLFQVSPHDPLVLSAAAALLFVISLLAVVKPAWKAAHTDPAQTLRVD